MVLRLLHILHLLLPLLIAIYLIDSSSFPTRDLDVVQFVNWTELKASFDSSCCSTLISKGYLNYIETAGIVQYLLVLIMKVMLLAVCPLSLGQSAIYGWSMVSLVRNVAKSTRRTV